MLFVYLVDSIVQCVSGALKSRTQGLPQITTLCTTMAPRRHPWREISQGYAIQTSLQRTRVPHKVPREVIPPSSLTTRPVSADDNIVKTRISRRDSPVYVTRQTITGCVLFAESGRKEGWRGCTSTAAWSSLVSVVQRVSCVLENSKNCHHFRILLIQF